jgi:transcription elongation GreA/GreB family factor
MARILPHEKKWIDEKLAFGATENAEAAEAMRNAVENGNVWHDNAEYDEVIERMKRIDSTYTPLVTLLGKSEIVDYPDVASNIIGVGSLVELQDPYETFDALLVGVPTVGQDIYEGMWQEDNKEGELTIVGAESPMGRAIIGLKVGALAVWSVGNKDLSANILGVNNEWLLSKVKQT